MLAHSSRGFCALSVGLWLLVCEESTTQGRGSDSHHKIWGKGGAEKLEKRNQNPTSPFKDTPSVT